MKNRHFGHFKDSKADVLTLKIHLFDFIIFSNVNKILLIIDPVFIPHYCIFFLARLTLFNGIRRVSNAYASVQKWISDVRPGSIRSVFYHFKWFQRVGSKGAKLFYEGDFWLHGRFHGSEEGEIEAWHGHSWIERRDYISLYIYWVTTNWYSFLKTFKTKNDHSFWSYGPFSIILKPFES